MPTGHRCTQEEVIARFKAVHGDRYDYSKVLFTRMANKIVVICPKHGEFEVTPHHHTRGVGCPYCAGKKHDMDWAIARAKEIYGCKYDYLPFEFKNGNSVMNIICSEHGLFHRTVQSHINDGSGCPECRLRKRYTRESFIKASQLVHGDKYEYIGNYINTQTPIAILCKKHDFVFNPIPSDHLRGSGCPICKESHGECEIAKWMDKHNIEYQRQYKVIPEQVLFGRKTFYVDFFIPKCNTVIEYHGEQHFIRRPIWQTEEQFQEQQDRDIRLREYCKRNKIRLIEISFTELMNIGKILDKKLGHQK